MIKHARFQNQSSQEDDNITKPNIIIDPWNQKGRSQKKSALRRFFSIIGTILIASTVFCLFIGSVYFLFPARINLLILGIDRAPEGTAIGRSDTNILATVLPFRGYLGMLSIPRDLWVAIPGVGENRINTAHFFAESQQAGSGPLAAMDTIRQNFGVDVRYYVRIQFAGLQELVDALGGLDITLNEQMAGYPPGTHHLSGEQALAFVRDRQGTDDFFRMAHGQVFIKQLAHQVMRPATWPRIPASIPILARSFDTNIPIWLWPRIFFTFIRTGPDGMDTKSITREMTTSYITDEGAQVLIPDWTKITPLVHEMFGQ